MNRRDHPPRYFHWLGLPLAVLVLCAFFAAGYALSRQIFRATGTPPEIAAYIVSSVLGVGLFAMMAKIVGDVRVRRHKDFDRNMTPFVETTLRALEQISRGDFNVFVPVSEHDPFSELAVSVNKMARELGSVEKLRQDFISNVSHEIQSPLTSISGFAALLRGDVTKAEIEHYAVIIENESRRLSKLSDNLLKLSTLEADGLSLETADFRLDKQLENTLLMLEPQWAKKRLTPEVSLTKCVIRGNEDLLSQVWINLLHNAIKFTPEGGVLRVTLAEDDREIRCAIADNGIGIPKEDQIHIFERFYKVDKSRDRALGGNGLGLSLVKKIVELHGGRVTVESEEGQGAAFTAAFTKAK